MWSRIVSGVTCLGISHRQKADECCFGFLKDHEGRKVSRESEKRNHSHEQGHCKIRTAFTGLVSISNRSTTVILAYFFVLIMEQCLARSPALSSCLSSRRGLCCPLFSKMRLSNLSILARFRVSRIEVQEARNFPPFPPHQASSFQLQSRSIISRDFGFNFDNF